MKASLKATALAAAFALALSPAAFAQTTPPEPPRRPQGPAAGPVIKLPPGASAVDERAQTPGPREGAAPAQAAPQRWEYCVINGFRYHQRGFSTSPRVPAAYVRYLPEGSEEIEGATEDEAVNNALAKLGDDGWELTAVRTDLQLQDGNGKAASVYFFKRQKRQE